MRQDKEQLIDLLWEEIKKGERLHPKEFRHIKRRYCRMQIEYKRDYGNYYDHYLNLSAQK